MKKIITIWFLFLTAFMNCGLMVSYLGCKFFNGNLGKAFCSCEQVLISSQNVDLDNQTAGNNLINDSHKLDSFHFFNQHFSKLQIIDHLSKDEFTFPFFSMNNVPKGFMASIFRPPAISFS